MGAKPTYEELEQRVTDLERQVSQFEQVRDDFLESEERYRCLVEESLSAIMAIQDGRFTYTNPAGARLLGYSDPEEMVGALALEHVAPSSRQLVAGRIERLEKGESNPPAEIELTRRDGTTVVIESSSASFTCEGKPTAVIIGQDITERKKTEDALRLSEAHFRTFMDHNPASIYMKDENDRHIYGNPAAFASVGKKPEEFIGSTTRDFFPPEVAARLIELDRKVLEENIPSLTEEWRNTAEGDTRWRKDIKFPINLGPGKKVLGGIAIDITSIKQNEQRLKNAYNEIKQLKKELEQENVYLREKIELRHEHKEIVGESKAINTVLKQAEDVAPTDSTVLILGGTGTGKELLAQTIHRLSGRKHRTMVRVSCASLPTTLVESELFGREKGAYTGALTREVGRFEIADGSTIFLDEIGEMSLETQAKLLTVLEEGWFERLGSSKTIKVDVRVIAATNRDLAKAAK